MQLHTQYQTHNLYIVLSCILLKLATQAETEAPARCLVNDGQLYTTSIALNFKYSR